MLDTAIYLVTKDIALRSGLISSRYRIADGRFVLDNKDLSRVRFTTDEYINGLSGVEKTDELTAKTLIAQNGYKMGEEVVEQPTPSVQTEEVVEEQQQVEEPVVEEETASEEQEEVPAVEEQEQEESVSEGEVAEEEETQGEESATTTEEESEEEVEEEPKEEEE